MAHRVFISYRHDDSKLFADLLYDHLVRRFGRRAVFFDEGIEGGQNWRREIERASATSKVVLAVIGPQWLEGTPGSRRIDDPQDVLRSELEAALRRTGVTVIPVVVGGAGVPEPEALPQAVRGLLDQQAMPLREGRDRTRDLEDIASRVAELVSAGPGRTWALAAAGLILAAVVGWVVWSVARHDDGPSSTGAGTPTVRIVHGTPVSPCTVLGNPSGEADTYVSPSSARIGETVTAGAASGFMPGELVEIRIGPVVVASTVAHERGQFQVTFHLPASVMGTPVQSTGAITAFGTCSGVNGKNQFEVLGT